MEGTAMHEILIVDDEASARQSLIYLLDWSEYGFHITAEAENGEKALACMRNHHFSLVLIDIRMPLMNGLEFIAKAREESDATFVIISGYDDFQYVQLGLRMGVEDYLLKPVSETDMIGLLHKVIKKQEVNREIRPNELMETVKKLIEEQYHTNISLRGIAQIVHLDPGYLGQLFKSYEKVTFNNYLLKIRMEKAKELLIQTDKKVYQIAQEIGYRELDWFYKRFKQYTGLSANEFKMKNGI